ncbi:MAG TPA: B12-binding domain-containing radical SAM protein [Candidatus Hydrogenedentes bacterium]|nr:B12-binding domain-containing radical SAM protein [Candidatus Hydrogenedentota bacterium]
MKGKKRLLLALVGPPPKELLYVTPPLGLMYIAAWLREQFALDIRIVNQRLEKWTTERLAREIIEYAPDIVGLGCMTPSAYALPELTKAVRKALPKSLIVLGGPHVAAFGAEALASTSADVAVPGEGEVAMEQIVRAFLEDDSMENVPGIFRREQDGTVVTNEGTAPFVEDLDSMPMPAYDLIDHRQYKWAYSMTVVPNRNYLSLFSSRGCPYGCIYCHNIFGRRFRAHSPERMVEEIKYYIKKYGIDEIEFVDDCFNLDRKRLLSYTELLLREVGPIKTTFPNAIRGDLLDEETVLALVNGGLYYTALSMESGSPRIQKVIGKNLDIPAFLKGVELCAKNGVFTTGYNMLGFPTETAADMEATIRETSESYLHFSTFFRATPFPGTSMYEYARKHCPEKLADISYDEMEYSLMRINLSAESDEVFDYYVRKAYRSFYLRFDRTCRILRDYPKPYILPLFLHDIVKRAWNRLV